MPAKSKKQQRFMGMLSKNNKLRKKLGITKVTTEDYTLQLRLKYYGIEKTDNLVLSRKKPKNIKQNISISYYGKELVKLYIYEKK